MNPEGPGFERFDVYMSRFLYGPSGFYTVGGVAGRRGDFLTSPEVGPLFGVLISRLLDRWWNELGTPETYSIYDVGTGPGTLVTSLNHAVKPLSVDWHITGIDRVGPSAEAVLPEDLSGAVVITNELLDNMAFRIVGHRSDGEWYEVFVDSRDPGRPCEHLVPIEAPGIDIPTGTRAPLHEQAQVWVEDILARGAERLLVIDYGVASTAELAKRGGWLRTYTGHKRGDSPYVDLGSCDITTDVAFDQFPVPDRLVTQAELLKELGIESYVEQGRRYWAEHASAPSIEAFKMRSRISEAEALCAPDGLGSWIAAMWSKHL